jgi:hypothetical protein
MQRLRVKFRVRGGRTLGNDVVEFGPQGPEKQGYYEEFRYALQKTKRIHTEAHEDREEEEKPGRNISVGV